MLSNVSTPLIGVVDTTVVGQIPDPAYIGAVAVGALIFSFVFWGFGFLRMGTTGLTAQALGAKDIDEVAANLGRALLIALAIGFVLIVLQWPIRGTAFYLLGGSVQVEELASQYFDIRIWAAPATLTNYALLGWLIGLGRTDVGLVLQLVLNMTNIALDALFVLGFGWDVRGVALGTLIAECVAAVVGLVFAWRQMRSLCGAISVSSLLMPERLRRTIIVNGDIMLRSLALIMVFVWFVAQGTRQGDVILAANAVLTQFISVGAFFLDGLAFAAEALVGRALGARHRAGLLAAVKITTVWAAATAVAIALLTALVGAAVIDFMTVDPAARAAARIYLPWVMLTPVLGVWAFQLDGVFIGATHTAQMRNAMIMTVVVYLIAWWLLRPFGNHGLWAALAVHYVARTGTLLAYYPGLLRSVPT
ncbi:MAG: MATE family efflux transporter [Gammaproteobacteria bacterium]|nr:MATE family efflux transporter [Gammaproteobacteria bacterium]